MDHSGHAHQMMGGGMSGDGGGGHAMTGMTGMPVAFEWGHRVTLFSHAWATETGFEYCVALAGIFLLCLAQEQLYYFRTTVRVGERPAASEDLSAPIVPKPYSVPGVKQRAVGTALYALNLASSYLIMLAVMTCNGGLFVTVVCGLSLGHFLGPSRRPAPGPGSSEACHPED